MSSDRHRLSQYLPSSEPSAPEDTRISGTVVAKGSDSNLVRTTDGQVVLTDKNGNRRSQ